MKIQTLADLQADPTIVILEDDMVVNQSVDYKADKLGVSIVKARMKDGTDNLDFYLIVDSTDHEQYYSETQLENALDDLLDPSFRRREAEQDARFVDQAYGPQD